MLTKGMENSLVGMPAGNAAPGCNAPATESLRRPLRVFMMDLVSVVPYYTGHLCAALKGICELRAELGSITYHLDRDFFRRQNLRTNPGLLDVVSMLSSAPAGLRRTFKLGECLINMLALLFRFCFSKPDVVHVQFLPMVRYGIPFELWFLRIVRFLGCKIVYTVHNVLPQDTGNLYQPVYRRIYDLADRLICHDTCAAARLIRDFGVQPNRISVIPHGPLFEQGSEHGARRARQRLDIAPQECVVLCQGIIRPYKGIPFLLEAWKQVSAQEPRAKLVVVGNGEPKLLREIENLVSTLGLGPSVRLDLRFVTVPELMDYYASADVLVYPYSEITTSGSLATGIGFGKAIVASRLPAFEQFLVDGDNALLVRHGDVTGLAGILIRLIREPGLRRLLGESAGKLRITGPHWPEIARQTSACYERALGRMPVRRGACAGNTEHSVSPESASV